MNTHDIETVLRSFLTGDGYIAADDIPAICATIEADRQRGGEPVKVPSDDVLADALTNLEHDNYEQSYSGYKNRQADIALIRASLARYGQRAQPVVFTDANCEERFTEHEANSCSYCGGSGHKDDVQPAEQVKVPSDEQAAFTAWAEVEYRNETAYTARDYRLGLEAWKQRARYGQQALPSVPEGYALVPVDLSVQVCAKVFGRIMSYYRANGETYPRVRQVHRWILDYAKIAPADMGALQNEQQNIPEIIPANDAPTPEEEAEWQRLEKKNE